MYAIRSYYASLKVLLNLLHCFFYILAMSIGRNANKISSSRAKTATWGYHDMAFIQEEIEEVPAVHTVWSLCPNVGTVYTTVYGQTDFFQALLDDLCIPKVILNQRPALLISSSAQCCKSTALSNVAGTVEECTLTTIPHRVQNTGRGILTFELLGDYGPAKTNTGKTGELP